MEEEKSFPPLFEKPPPGKESADAKPLVMKGKAGYEEHAPIVLGADVVGPSQQPHRVSINKKVVQKSEA